MDLSTIGIKLGWAVETTAGTKPTAYKWLQRCSKIGGLNITREKNKHTINQITLTLSTFVNI